MKRVLFVSLLLVVVVSGCKKEIDEPEMRGDAMDSAELNDQAVHAEVEPLEVELMNEDGVGVGVAIFSEGDKGVQIELDAHHLNPGVHGFHIHEKGICEAPTFESAGGHFNPTNKKHGFDHPEGPHAGDMENIEVEDDGRIKVTIINDMVTLKEGEVNSLISKEGTSLMIHANPDDYVSQPAGDAGERIVCGVISFPEKEEKKLKN